MTFIYGFLACGNLAIYFSKLPAHDYVALGLGLAMIFLGVVSK